MIIRPPTESDAAPRVDANGATRAIQGGGAATATSVTIRIETTDGVLYREDARMIADRAVSGDLDDNVGQEVVFVDSAGRTGDITELPPRPPPPEQPPEQSEPVNTFRCEVAEHGRCGLYEALPSVLLSMNGLPSYAERMSAVRDGNGGWARVEAVRGEWRAKKASPDGATPGKLAYDHRRIVGRAGVGLRRG